MPGFVALALMGVFTVVLVRAQARHVPCLCFGVASLDPPVGPASIIRNGVLAGLAVLAIGDPSGANVVGDRRARHCVRCDRSGRRPRRALNEVRRYCLRRSRSRANSPRWTPVVAATSGDAALAQRHDPADPAQPDQEAQCRDDRGARPRACPAPGPSTRARHAARREPGRQRRVEQSVEGVAARPDRGTAGEEHRQHRDRPGRGGTRTRPA